MNLPKPDSQIPKLVLMVLLVCASAWAGIKLSLDAGNVACLWPANGIISAFVLAAPRRWKWPFFAAGVFTMLGVDIAWGDPLPPAIWIAVCDVIEILIIVLPLKHIAGRAEVANKRTLFRIAYLGSFFGPLACAVLVAPAMFLLHGDKLLDTIRIWFLSDALGNVASLPLILFVLTRKEGATRTFDGKTAHLSHDIAWGCFLVAVAVGVFWQTTYPIIFLVFPPLIAIVFRFRLTGAIFGASLLVVIAAAFTAEGHGDFALRPGTTPAERVMLFQIFGLIAFASCLPVGLLIEERHRLEAELTLANEQLRELALLDGLTGVNNHRSFDEQLVSEWSTASATERDTSTLYLDIDYFKSFNDTYGHQQGDDCLRAVAAAIVANVRKNYDLVARYGGEEFVVLLPGVSAVPALEAANRIVGAILDLKIPHRASPFGIVTASIGVATARPGKGRDPSGLVRLADEALYAAKREGRNRTVANTQPPKPALEFSFP